MNTTMSLFQGKQIRKVLHQGEWWFVIEDVVSVLTDSVNPKDYLKKMRLRDTALAKGWGQIVTPLVCGKILTINVKHVLQVLTLVWSFVTMKIALTINQKIWQNYI